MEWQMVGGPLYSSLLGDLRSRPSLYKDCSTYEILLCSLSFSITKGSKSKAPIKPSKPPAPNFDLADESPSYSPGEKASGDKTPSSSPSSSKIGSDDFETPKEKFPHTSPPFHQAGPEANTFFLSERWQDQKVLHWFTQLRNWAFLNFWYEPN